MHEKKRGTVYFPIYSMLSSKCLTLLVSVVSHWWACGGMWKKWGSGTCSVCIAGKFISLFLQKQKSEPDSIYL